MRISELSRAVQLVERYKDVQALIASAELVKNATGTIDVNIASVGKMELRQHVLMRVLEGERDEVLEQLRQMDIHPDPAPKREAVVAAAG